MKGCVSVCPCDELVIMSRVSTASYSHCWTWAPAVPWPGKEKGGRNVKRKEQRWMESVNRVFSKHIIVLKQDLWVFLLLIVRNKNEFVKCQRFIICFVISFCFGSQSSESNWSFNWGLNLMGFCHSCLLPGYQHIHRAQTSDVHESIFKHLQWKRKKRALNK